MLMFFICLAFFYSSTVPINAMSRNIVEYEEVKNIPNPPEKFLFDVRNATEIAEIGSIPKAVNVPLSEVEAAFSDETSPEEFIDRYNGLKPKKDDYIIMTCRSGRRSGLAIEILERLGYTNLWNYSGSWLDWAEKEGIKSS